MSTRFRFHKNNRTKKRRCRAALWAAGFVLTAAAAALCGVQLFRIFEDTRRGAAMYDELAGASGAPSASQTAPDRSPNAPPAPEPPPDPDFDALAAINDDVVGWLWCRDVPIDYPVVQTSDNYRYLTTLFNGEDGRLGTPYLDFRCDAAFEDDVSVIYGHHLSSGDMFSCLLRWRREGYYDEHPEMTLCTPHGDYTLQLFAGWVQDVSGGFDFTFHYGEDGFDRFVADAKALSDFDSPVTPVYGDRVVLLCTCETTNTTVDTRYVLAGVLVPVPPERPAEDLPH